MELLHPVIHMVSATGSLPVLPNKCYIAVLTHQDSVNQVERLAEQMQQQPRLVIYTDTEDPASVGVHSYPWVRLVPGSTVIFVTCFGNERKGLLYDLSRTLGHVEDICSMRNKELRIAYNNLPIYFQVNDGIIDQTGFEGLLLQTFLKAGFLKISMEFPWRGVNFHISFNLKDLLECVT